MARFRRTACVAGCVAAAQLGGAAGATAAVPKTGSWDSGSHTEPTVSFEVRGAATSRMIRRVSFPEMCRTAPEPTGEVWFDVARRVRAGRRAVITGEGFTLLVRFVTATRANVTLRNHEDADCRGSWRFVVRHTRPRVPVRNGRWLALVEGGTATMEFEVRAFGRVAEVQFLSGSVVATCSDGSQRSLSLLGSPAVIAAPLRPAGRFDAVGTKQLTVEVSGTFDHGSVAALLNVSEALPDGTRCQARGLYVLGALGFPYY
jgi:hypothetical protein